MTALNQGNNSPMDFNYPQVSGVSDGSQGVSVSVGSSPSAGNTPVPSSTTRVVDTSSVQIPPQPIADVPVSTPNGLNTSESINMGAPTSMPQVNQSAPASPDTPVASPTQPSPMPAAPMNSASPTDVKPKKKSPFKALADKFNTLKNELIEVTDDKNPPAPATPAPMDPTMTTPTSSQQLPQDGLDLSGMQNVVSPQASDIQTPAISPDPISSEITADKAMTDSVVTNEIPADNAPSEKSPAENEIDAAFAEFSTSAVAESVLDSTTVAPDVLTNEVAPVSDAVASPDTDAKAVPEEELTTPVKSDALITTEPLMTDKLDSEELTQPVANTSDDLAMSVAAPVEDGNQVSEELTSPQKDLDTTSAITSDLTSVPEISDAIDSNVQTSDQDRAPAEEAPITTAKKPKDETPTLPEVSGDVPGPVNVPEGPAVQSTGKPYPYNISYLLDLVIERDASDLHITAGYPAMLRIDGKLQPIGNEIVSDKVAPDLILPVLPENKKELLEVNREVDLAYAHRDNARFRINAYFQKQTLAGAFRLIPNKIRNIDELNLPAIYHQFAKLGQGLVLVTGPTGHGKSTTLAAILQEINETRNVHMITIEDPIEYVFPKGQAMVDQREMHDDTHSWEIALRSALRQDPDVILVGEMRDYETIASAITLAETGHLVFATLHTNNAAQTVDRIIDVFPEHQQAQVRTQLANIIETVIAQRLVPIQGGGRRAVSEIMLANAAVRNLIREAKTHQLDNVIRTSADIGMISLESSLVKLVREGVITVDTAQEYAAHPEEVIRLMKG